MPRKTHCKRGHERTRANVGSDGMCLTCKRAGGIARRAADTRPKDPVRVACGKLGYQALVASGKAGVSTPNKMLAARATWERRRAQGRVTKPRHRLTDAERLYRQQKRDADKAYRKLMREAKREYERWLAEPVVPLTHRKAFDCRNAKPRRAA